MAEVTHTRAGRRLCRALLFVAGLVIASPVAAFATTEPGTAQGTGGETGEETTTDTTIRTLVEKWTEKPSVSTPTPPAPPPRVELPPVASTRPDRNAPDRSRSPATALARPLETAPQTSAAVALEPAATDKGSGAGPLVVGALLVAVLIGGVMAWRRQRMTG